MSHAGVFTKQVKVNPNLPDADIVELLATPKSKATNDATGRGDESE